MEFSDIVLNVFETIDEEELYLNEGLYPITPFLAFLSWKKKYFNKGGKFSKFSVKNLLNKLKSGILLSKEKTLAHLGLPSGKSGSATVYELTKLQYDVMSEIYSKYKKNYPTLINRIMKFRNETLSAYQLIKRIIKQTNRVSSKDIWGISKNQFKSSLESGRKKIKKREKYFEMSNESQKRIREINDNIKNLDKLKKDFETGRQLNQNILSKVYKKYGVGEDEFGIYTPEKIRSTYLTLMKNYKSIVKLLSKTQGREFTDKEIENSQVLRHYRKDLLSGKGIDLTQEEKTHFSGKKIGFNAALGKYFLRKEILKELKPNSSNIFRKTYVSIVKKMIEKAKEYKYEKVLKLNNLRKSLEFNKLEKKIWEKKSTVKNFSGNVDDYFQKIREEDFLEKPIYIKRSPALIKAEQDIENEIKKFERDLTKIMTKEDIIKLKKYRLIDNLISIKELKSPEDLFKSASQIKNVTEED